MPPSRSKLSKKKKVTKKKSTKKKTSKKAPARKVKAEIVARIRNAPGIKKITNIAEFKKRMLYYWDFTKGQLERAAESPTTLVHDLIIIRMLTSIIEYNNMITLQFFLDVAIGDNKILGGDANGGAKDAGPVTVYEIPTNGSENLNKDADDL